MFLFKSGYSQQYCKIRLDRTQGLHLQRFLSNCTTAELSEYGLNSSPVILLAKVG